MTRLLVVAALFSFAGCGGDGDGGPGEALLASTGSGSADGKAFTPEYGVSVVLPSGTVSSFFGSGEVNCQNVRNESGPPNGIYVNVQVPEAKVGVPAKHFFNFTIAENGDFGGGGSNAGSVEVTKATAEVIGFKVDYDATVNGKRYVVNGTFEVKRCP
jgi:hypothetical protein